MLLKLASLSLPILYFIFIVADRAGVWSRLRGLDLVENVATRFEKSYAPDASRPVNVGDSEWEPLMRIIDQYSTAKLPADRKPQSVARYQACASCKVEGSNGQIIAEWTAFNAHRRALSKVAATHFTGELSIRGHYR